MLTLYSPKKALRPAVPQQLRDDQHPRRAVAHQRRGPGDRCSGRSTIRCASGWIPRNSPTFSLTPADISDRHPGAEHAGRAGRDRRRAGVERSAQRVHGSHARSARQCPTNSAISSCKTNPNGSVVSIKDVARVEIGAEFLGPLLPLQRRARPRRSASISRPAPTRSRSPRRCASRWRSWRKRFPQDLNYTVFFDTTVFVHVDDRGGAPHAGRSLRAGWRRRVPVPRQAAHDANSVDRRAGFDHRRFRGACWRSAIPPTRFRCWRWCWPSASWSTTRSS